MFPTPEPHRALQGFQIKRRLGSGGVGEVFLATSKGGRAVAIKVLSDAKVRDAAFSKALVREASLCVRLTHPAIVQVRALIEDEGFAAIVFDYVEGVPLARLMKLCTSRGVRMPDKVAWHIVERVLSALAYAHKQTDETRAPAPIVHRDVSPSNVLISWHGDVKLTDFGIAKMLGVSPATTYGLVKGTLGCMAPEQARGEPVDERADVYAAGLLAWRLSTGRNPYAAQDKDEIELLRAMKNPHFKPLSALRPNLPEALLEAVASALEADPKNRLPTAEQFAKIVRAHVEVDAGLAELSRLLGQWRPALEKKRKANPLAIPTPNPSAVGALAFSQSVPAVTGLEERPSAPSLDPSMSSSGDHKLPTMRYEDVDHEDGGDEEDDPAVQDRPTIQVQALPESWVGPGAAPARDSSPDEPVDLPPMVPSESAILAPHQSGPPSSPQTVPAPPPAAAPRDGASARAAIQEQESDAQHSEEVAAMRPRKPWALLAVLAVGVVVTVAVLCLAR